MPPAWNELPHAPSTGAMVCSRASLTDGQATMASVGAYRLLVLRDGDAVRAFANRCAHFGVPLAERPEQLIQIARVSITCNVHYAKYRFSDGGCLSGECDGEGLIGVPVVVDDAGDVRIA